MSWRCNINVYREPRPEGGVQFITLLATVEADSESDCLAGMDEVWKLYCGMKRWVRKIQAPTGGRDHVRAKECWKGIVRLYYVNEPGEATQLKDEYEQILMSIEGRP